jgi:hypothetical protein
MSYHPTSLKKGEALRTRRPRLLSVYRSQRAVVQAHGALTSYGPTRRTHTAAVFHRVQPEWEWVAAFQNTRGFCWQISESVRIQNEQSDFMFLQYLGSNTDAAVRSCRHHYILKLVNLRLDSRGTVQKYLHLQPTVS